MSFPTVTQRAACPYFRVAEVAEVAGAKLDLSSSNAGRVRIWKCGRLVELKHLVVPSKANAEKDPGLPYKSCRCNAL